MSRELKKDLIFAGMLFLIALLVRLPYISSPREIIFDEGVYVSQAVHTKLGQSFFDAHPPMSWYFYSLFITQEEATEWRGLDLRPGASFELFPFGRLRFVSAFLGALVAVFLFITARCLGFRRHLSLLPALFAIFDNGLVIYSRLILPDTLLLFFGTAGLMCAALGQIVEKRKNVLILSFVAGLLIGLSVTVKWTGLGYLLPAVLLFLSRRYYREALIFIVAAPIAYVLLHVCYASEFPPGQVPLPSGYYWVETSQEGDFVIPEKGDVWGYVLYAIDYGVHVRRFQEGYTETFRDFINAPPLKEDTFHLKKPYHWPFSRALFTYWTSADLKRQIVLFGNVFTWILGFLAVLYGIIKVAYVFWQRTLREHKTLFVAVIGYLFNYLPFFFIDRPMFMFHYFGALVFSFLLVPFVVEDIRGLVQPNVYRLCVGTIVFGMVIMYFIGLKTTYAL